jgi:glycosyltransferase involved in cell wall biosynthesis
MMAEFSVDDSLQNARDTSGLPLVSVIIPAYNYESYVGIAIKSVIAQTYLKIEIIVVDDGSTDCTSEVVHSFGNRVRYVRKSNGGLASARNLGIRRAKGEFLLFLDADDELEPEAIECMYDAFSKLSSDYALITCSFIKINDVGDVIGIQGSVPAGDADISCRQLVLRNRFPVTALARRIAIVECGMFDPEYGTTLGSEDRDMWVRISAIYKIHMLTKPLLRKREHGRNMSSHASNQSRGMIRTISKARSSGAVSCLNFPFWAQVGAIRRFQVALMRRECGHRSGAWWELLKSVFAWPWFYSLREVGLAPFFRMRCALRWITDRNV